MLLERVQVDTDISHAAQALFDDHEARIAAIEDHLGLSDNEDDVDAEDGEGEDDENTEGE